MHVVETDLANIGVGGAGLRAAISAADGGSAGVITDQDTLDLHFKDAVSGGDWLCRRLGSVAESRAVWRV